MRRIATIILLALGAFIFASCSADTEPATNVTSSSATLNGKGKCDSAEDDGQYRYAYRAVGASSWTSMPWRPLDCPGPTAVVALPSQDVTGLSASTQYEFRLEAEFPAYPGSNFSVDSTGAVNSGTPNYDRFTTLAPVQDNEDPSTTPNFHVTSSTQTSVSVAWDAATDNVGVTSYALYRGGVFVDEVFVPEDPRTFTFSGLTCGTNHSFGIRARDDAGNQTDTMTTVSGSTSSCTPPPPGGGNGFWLTSAEIAALPTSGTPYNNTLSAANAFTGSVTLSNQDENQDRNMLAQAIIGRRLNDSARLAEVTSACTSVQNTENGGRVLALARNLTNVVAACAIAGVSPSSGFGTWLAAVRTEGMTECTNLKACSERRPNNWGTMSLAARAAASAFLGDTADLNNLWEHLQDFYGRSNGGYVFSSPAETYSCLGALSNLRGIEPPGCTKSGVNLDGAVPDDARRCGAFTSPPCLSEPYDYEGRQGIIVVTVIMQRQGYAAKTSQSSAVRRSYQYLARLGRAPQGDDTWQPWLEQCLYGTASFTPSDSATGGKNMGWTAYTHRDQKCG